MSFPIAVEIKSIRENYDTSNPMVANILKAKEERMKILQQLHRQQENEFSIEEPSLLNSLMSTENDKVKKVKKKKIRHSDRFPIIALRKSSRISNLRQSWESCFNENVNEDVYENVSPQPDFVRPPNEYGAVPGVEIGFHWETRLECSRYGVHRPTVAGIHGGPKGAYSIALSGGYPEDVDEGHTFLYTGAGGRDLKGTATNPKNLRTAPQTRDQELEGTNLSLVKSIDSKLPIRVIRGYKSPSIFAPETGYRYDGKPPHNCIFDNTYNKKQNYLGLLLRVIVKRNLPLGLYQVVDYWEDVGKSGHRIYRFRMERIKDQPPPPWEDEKRSNFRMWTAENCDPDGLSEDSKENIRPDPEMRHNEVTNSDEYSAAPTTEEIEYLDKTIQECIRSLCKTGDIRIGKTGDKSDFPGWDEEPTAT
ncbi:hypothetical protein RUM43_012114 [Polyplax serrata]|uniref:YDG domain-containing protein n=1 Tax=Polyplax serrata TaxID=468196 RepID=A0AAN8P6B5_POLSC